MVTMNNSNTMKMSSDEIELYTRRFLKDNYNLELAIPVAINSRLTTTLGQFVHTRNKHTGERKPVRLEFSKKFLENGKLEDILSTIRHESIHLALFILDKPYKDGMPLFESELKKHGANSTGTTELLIERNVRVYKCNCDEFVFLRTITPKICVSCRGKLQYAGRRKQLM